MDSPGSELREELRAWPFAEEGECEAALYKIDEKLMGAIGDLGRRNPDKVLAAVTEWASLASYVVARTYGPASPMPFPGWSNSVARAVTRVAGHLSKPLAWVAKQTQALDYQISVGYPWGFAVGLSYPPAP